MTRDFFEKNSLHDGYIKEVNYCKETKYAKMNIIQLYSELDQELLSEVDLGQDDLVEIELYIGNVYYISSMESDYSAYEIVDVFHEQNATEEILLFKLHVFGGYKEISIKGKKLKVSTRIKGKH